MGNVSRVRTMAALNTALFQSGIRKLHDQESLLMQWKEIVTGKVQDTGQEI